MQKIIEAITNEIKDEVLKDSLDFPKLQNLVRFAIDIKSITVETLEEASLVESGSTLSVRAMPAQRVGYGPSSMERLIGEYMPQLFAMLGSQNEFKGASSIVSLMECYATLRKQDINLALELRGYITALLKKEKEVNHEDIHTESTG